MATSCTSERFSNPSVISFSSTEMAANMVNWAKLWANWFLMQLASTFILRVIANCWNGKPQPGHQRGAKDFLERPETQFCCCQSSLWKAEIARSCCEGSRLSTKASRQQGVRSGRRCTGKVWCFNFLLDNVGWNYGKSKLVSPRTVVIPAENLRTQRKHHRVMKFTADEDDFLTQGINR